jgi:hypothetical protein
LEDPLFLLDVAICNSPVPRTKTLLKWFYFLTFEDIKNTVYCSMKIIFRKLFAAMFAGMTYVGMCVSSHK